MLFLLDEFVALRHMKEAERGVAKGRKGVAMLMLDTIARLEGRCEHLLNSEPIGTMQS